MITQLSLLSKILHRKNGVTAMEIISVVGTTSPHKRMSELRDLGWTITKKQVEDTNYHKYFGVDPKNKN